MSSQAFSWRVRHALAVSLRILRITFLLCLAMLPIPLVSPQALKEALQRGAHAEKRVKREQPP